MKTVPNPNANAVPTKIVHLGYGEHKAGYEATQSLLWRNTITFSI